MKTDKELAQIYWDGRNGQIKDMEAAMEAVRQACTIPLLKRIAELENDLYRWQQMQRNQMRSIKELQSILSRIRALPEKWNETWGMSRASICANELLAALGESQDYGCPPVKHPEVEPLQERFGQDRQAERLIAEKLAVDPYAELKAAHKAGKVIQLNCGGDEWEDLPVPTWNMEPEHYRIKPWSLPPPPEGRQWHRDDWTEEMLPEGWRPLFYNEIPISGDECLDKTGHWTDDLILSRDTPRKKSHFHTRTKRPLPPLPTLVPLEAKDVQVGWTIQEPTGCEWLITGKQESAIFFHEDWAELSDITHCKLSADHGATWKPAKKLKEASK